MPLNLWNEGVSDPMDFIDSYLLGFDDLLWADIFVLGYYLLIIVVLFTSVVFALQTFRGRISWGQARVMGVPFAIYVWIQAMFLFVLLDGLFGIAAFILSTPIWIDLTVSAVGIAVPIALFLVLKRRPTFKPHLFMALVLVPLGVPGTHLLARLAKVEAIEVAGAAGLAAVKYADDVAPLALRNADEIVDIVPVIRGLPHVTHTLAGEVRFVTSSAKGRFGDLLTARRITAQGYVKLPSKYNSIHGIDGIYAKRDASGAILGLVIVENKVDKGWLFPGQMSDAWIAEALSKMASSADGGARATAQEVHSLIEGGSSIVRKELWHHDLTTGSTTVKALDADGRPGAVLQSWQDAYIKNRLVEICRTDSSTCSFVAQ